MKTNYQQKLYFIERFWYLWLWWVTRRQL